MYGIQAKAMFLTNKKVFFMSETGVASLGLGERRRKEKKASYSHKETHYSVLRELNAKRKRSKKESNITHMLRHQDNKH